MIELLCLSALAFIPAQGDLPFDGDRALNPATRQTEIQSLASAYLSAYKDDVQETLLDNRFRIEAVAGDYPAAIKDLEQLRALPSRQATPFKAALDVQYLVALRAHTDSGSESFEDKLTKSFRAIVEPLDNTTSSIVVRTMTWTQAAPLGNSVQAGLEACKGKRTIAADAALALIRNDFAYTAFSELSPVTNRLVAEDDALRYIIDPNVSIRTEDGGTVCATIVRPKDGKPLPAILEYTIYNGSSVMGNARLSAGFGYVGVVGLTRGKGNSPDKPWPYVHDGADAAMLIDWLAKQPWCDGRVGMLGGSYDGFSQWAAAKHMPKALKCMMDSASASPGIDVPMEGNVVWNFLYPWPFYTTDNKTEDNVVYGDRDRWNRLDRNFYLSGQPYKDLEKIDNNASNPVWDEWLSHPNYDSYWQSMVPFRAEFAKIDIPILTTAGYFYGGPGACAYYYREHTKYKPRAEHYLVVGPWDHFSSQIGVYSLLGREFANFGGYLIDPVARLNLEDLRFRWLDYVLKGGPKPDLLQDKVNYELTGANEWKHVPSLAAMSDSSARLYLSPAQRLVSARADGDSTLTVDLANRKDIDEPSPGAILSSSLPTPNSLVFEGDPLPETTDVSGFLSGRLDFVTNKKDFDFSIRLYEHKPSGQYFQVGEYWSRASAVGDLTRRRLLIPGKRTQLDFQAIRLMGHRCEKGSRLVIVLGAIKEVGREINYGSGKPVIEESVADAGEPIQIRWSGSSYVNVPTRKG